MKHLIAICLLLIDFPVITRSSSKDGALLDTSSGTDAKGTLENITLGAAMSKNFEIIKEEMSVAHSGFNETDSNADVSCGYPKLSFLNKTGDRCLAESIAEEENEELKNFCPKVWDNFLCWPATPPDIVASVPCSEFHCDMKEGVATRYCNKSGRWNGSHPNGDTNYSICIQQMAIPHHVDWIHSMKLISKIGYSISFASLVISFSIIVSFRRLRDSKNILHLHLFASFMLRALVVFFSLSLMNGEAIQMLEQTNKGSGLNWCRTFMFFWQYFVVANYSWIFMEGLYLHNLMMSALARDPSAINIYIFLGWVLPTICVGLWAILRSTFDDVGCWSVNTRSWIYWISIRGPVGTSNFINFVFFVRVLRLVVQKMGSTINPESMQYKKLARSTFSLVAVFGAHYFLLSILSFSKNKGVELTYLILDQVLASFQGFFVAFVYCFMNTEVRKELKKLYYRRKGEPYPYASHSTVISHTKTYMSRGGRTSLHSINSATMDTRSGRPGGGQTPSPQMPRSFYDDISSNRFSVTPRNLSPMNSQPQTPDMTDLLQCKISTTHLKVDSIELLPCAVVPQGGNLVLQPQKIAGKRHEEEIPLLFIETSATGKEGSKVMTNKESSQTLTLKLNVENDIEMKHPLDVCPEIKTEKLVSVNEIENIKSDDCVPKDVLVKHNPVSQSNEVKIVTDSEEVGSGDRRDGESIL